MNIFLDKLELHGFKSFPEKTVIRFHRGITAVIGPNGCGKSNIVDAILWVLGEQRIKNLRGENTEDLIFNGSASKKPLGMTEVAATFQTEAEPVYIARRFFRTGDGKYVHNERTVRHKDIQDELFKMNLGGTGYYIFEQGSIEKLLALKPTEQRGLIEEAAGIAKYLERKKETAGKLIISQQNLENIDILLADKGERLKELRNQVNYVQRYRKSKEEWQRAQKTLISRRYCFFSDDFSAHQQVIATLLNEEALLGKEAMALEAQVLAGEEKRWRQEQQLKESQKQAYEANGCLTRLAGELEQLNQRQGFLRQRVVELTTANDKALAELRDLGAQSEQAQEQQRLGLAAEKQLRHNLETLTAQQKELAQSRSQFMSREKDLARTLIEAQSRQARAGNELREMEKSLMRAENDVLARQKIVSALKDQAGLPKQGDLAAQVAEQTEELEQLTARLEGQEKAIAALRVRQQKVDEGCRVLAGTQQTLAHHRGKMLELKNKLVVVTDGPGRPNAGCLQDFIEAAAQDRPLLESFFYEFMDAPVVDGDDASLISRLKKAKLKRADTVRDLATLSAEPGCDGTVHDLFTLRDGLDKGLFPDGLVVADLAAALRIHLRHGVPLVARDGTSITADGLLMRKREKGVLDVLAEIRRLETEQQETDTRLLAARAEKASVDEEMKRQQQLVAKLANERRDRDKEVMRLRSDWESMRRQAEQTQRRIAATETEIQMALETKQELEEARLEAQARLTLADEQLRAALADKETFQVEGQASQAAMSEQEKKVMQKRHECQLQHERAEALSAQTRRLTQQIDRLTAQREQNEQDMIRFREEADGLDGEKAKNREQKLLFQRQKKQFEEEISALEKGLDGVGVTLKKASEALNQGRKRLEEVREKRSHEERVVSELKKDIFALQELAFKELGLELRDVQADEEYAALSMERLGEMVLEMDDRLRKMRDSDRLNFSAESEYELLMKEHGFLESQKLDVLTSIEDMNQAISKIDAESQQKFRVAFKEISENFIANFKILFEGGEAELALMEPDNVLETGLEIKAQPPGKRLQGLRLLSGGEKTLTSLAFLFALFQYKPSPFCVFDEVDASLDEANIQRFLKFLHTLKVNTQFLIITHNFKTMEEADYIYGISMNEPGISSVYSMKLTGAEKLERLDA
jgi:chromosome segregation protein